MEAAPAPPAAIPADDADPRALSDFRPALDPYGAWVQDPAYGLVWVPHQSVVGRNFAPYVTSGRWELNHDDQWIWVSDYPFGWVVFHYGRWVWTNSGWAWIPGYRYAPAWVDWRVSDYDYGYVGWAPYPPSYVWFNGVAVSLWFTPYYAWVFCPTHYVFSPHVHFHVVRDRALVYRVAARTRIYSRVYGGSRYYYGAPRSPSPSVARIPARVVPRHRVEADPRSLEIARRSSVRDVSAHRIAPRSVDRAPSATAPGGVIRAGRGEPVRAAPRPRSLPDARSAAGSRPARVDAPVRRAPRADSDDDRPVLRRPRVATPPSRPSRSSAPRSLPSRPPVRSMPRGGGGRRLR